MARIRTIKPEFFTSEDITSMTPLARLFYVSLWCEADRQGRMEWKPGTFKLRYLPGDACDVPVLAKQLIERGLIVLYTVDGRQYAEIPTFTEHQVINNRESESTIPARDKHASRTRAPRVKAEGKEGKEGKGKEGKEPAVKDAARFEDFWTAWPKSERKQDRKACAVNWAAHELDDLADKILSDVAIKRQTEKWRGGFIEAPLVYLNNRRWEDGAGPVSDAECGQMDPNSKAAIEARGVAAGLGKWNEMKERWFDYAIRVKETA